MSQRKHQFYLFRRKKREGPVAINSFSTLTEAFRYWFEEESSLRFRDHEYYIVCLTLRVLVPIKYIIPVQGRWKVVD